MRYVRSVHTVRYVRSAHTVRYVRSVHTARYVRSVHTVRCSDTEKHVDKVSHSKRELHDQHSESDTQQARMAC